MTRRLASFTPAPRLTSCADDGVADVVEVRRRGRRPRMMACFASLACPTLARGPMRTPRRSIAAWPTCGAGHDPGGPLHVGAGADAGARPRATRGPRSPRSGGPRRRAGRATSGEQRVHPRQGGPRRRRVEEVAPTPEAGGRGRTAPGSGGMVASLPALAGSIREHVVHLIVNPSAGRGRGLAHLDAVVAALRADGRELIVLRSETAGHARTLVDAVPDGGTVVAMGGDGTVHELLPACLARDLRLGVVPCGSGDDFAFAVGIPRHDPLAAVATVLAGHERRVDVGLVDGHPYVNTFGSGFDADVARRVIAAPLVRPRPRALPLRHPERDARLLARRGAGRAGARLAAGAIAFEGPGPAWSACRTDRGPAAASCSRPARRRTTATSTSWSPARSAALGTLGILPKLMRGRHLDHPKVHRFAARALDADVVAAVAGADEGEIQPPRDALPACALQPAGAAAVGAGRLRTARARAGHGRRHPGTPRARAPSEDGARDLTRGSLSSAQKVDGVRDRERLGRSERCRRGPRSYSRRRRRGRSSSTDLVAEDGLAASPLSTSPSRPSEMSVAPSPAPRVLVASVVFVPTHGPPRRSARCWAAGTLRGSRRRSTGVRRP